MRNRGTKANNDGHRCHLKATHLDTATILSVNIANRPGALGDIAKALASGGVNIDGFSVERGMVRFITGDVKGAQAVVEAAGFKAKPITVFVLQVPNKPGALAHMAQAFSDAGVDIINTFGVTHGSMGTIYVRVEHIEAARQVLSDLQGFTIKR